MSQRSCSAAGDSSTLPPRATTAGVPAVDSADWMLVRVGMPSHQDRHVGRPERPPSGIGQLVGDASLVEQVTDPVDQIGVDGLLGRTRQDQVRPCASAVRCRRPTARRDGQGGERCAPGPGEAAITVGRGGLTGTNGMPGSPKVAPSNRAASE